MAENKFYRVQLYDTNICKDVTHEDYETLKEAKERALEWVKEIYDTDELEIFEMLKELNNNEVKFNSCVDVIIPSIKIMVG